jgi:hypothetical protein
VTTSRHKGQIKPVLRIRIRDQVPFDPWLRDPGWVKNQDTDLGYGSGLNNPDHISESLETTFGVKILKFFDADPDPGWKKIRNTG